MCNDEALGVNRVSLRQGFLEPRWETLDGLFREAEALRRYYGVHSTYFGQEGA
jgi:hypothetical protein